MLVPDVRVSMYTACCCCWGNPACVVGKHDLHIFNILMELLGVSLLCDPCTLFLCETSVCAGSLVKHVLNCFNVGIPLLPCSVAWDTHMKEWLAFIDAQLIIWFSLIARQTHYIEIPSCMIYSHGENTRSSGSNIHINFDHVVQPSLVPRPHSCVSVWCGNETRFILIAK